MLPNRGTETPRIGEVLVELGFVTPTQLEQALSEQRIAGERIGETLIRLDFLSRGQLAIAVGEQSIRRFLSAVGMTAVALHPSLAAAGSARASLGVSATVTTSASADARLLDRPLSGSVGDPKAASLTLACQGRIPVTVGFEWGKFTSADGGGTAAAATKWGANWKVSSARSLSCSEIPQKILADSATPLARKSKINPDDYAAVNIVISY